MCKIFLSLWRGSLQNPPKQFDILTARKEVWKFVSHCYGISVMLYFDILMPLIRGWVKSYNAVSRERFAKGIETRKRMGLQHVQTPSRHRSIRTDCRFSDHWWRTFTAGTKCNTHTSSLISGADREPYWCYSKTHIRRIFLDFRKQSWIARWGIYPWASFWSKNPWCWQPLYSNFMNHTSASPNPTIRQKHPQIKLGSSTDKRNSEALSPHSGITNRLVSHGVLCSSVFPPICELTSMQKSIPMFCLHFDHVVCRWFFRAVIQNLLRAPDLNYFGYSWDHPFSRYGRC